MSSKVFSACTYGIDGRIIEIEVDTSPGIHCFNIVGLPDAAVKEAKDRVSSAIKNSGFKAPHFFGRITVNLAPAELKKEGPSFDLPIALGILLASHQIEELPKKSIFIGELALDGRLRPNKGSLAISIAAQDHGFKKIFLPKDSAKEANLAQKIAVFPLKTLNDLINLLKNEKDSKPLEKNNFFEEESFEDHPYDFCYIKGQEHVKRALEIAVAGAHNILLSGPPGSGKTMIAKSIPSIMPKMNWEEILETSKIHSVSGLTNEKEPFLKQRPFRSPHHSASAVSLVGGGSFPRPGEISLANRGVLFLDEFPEFSKEVIENLRQPLEDGYINISRAQGKINYPAKFILVAAMNPCPCGNASDPEKNCTCTTQQIQRYQRKLSGPIMDRIDLHIEVPRLKFEKLSKDSLSEKSKLIRARIEKSRNIQKQRLKEDSLISNSEMNSKHLRKYCKIGEEEKLLLKDAVSQMNLSPRAYHRLLKVSRTIADLEGSKNITTNHLAEAIQYRFHNEE